MDADAHVQRGGDNGESLKKTVYDISRSFRVQIGSLQMVVDDAAKGCQDSAIFYDAVVTYYGSSIAASMAGNTISISASPLEGVAITFGAIHEKADLEICRIADDYALGRRDPNLGSKDDEPWNINRRCLLPETNWRVEVRRLIQGWLNQCKDKHQACPKSFENFLPKRTLECDNGQVYLREMPGTRATYACLSHCWGPDGPTLTLVRDTIAEVRAGISLDMLPKLFADAIKVCDELGIKYVWIDALCILQDDANDWEEAAATMADIYENSCITIAAAHSPSSDHGLFSPERPVVKRLQNHPHLAVRAKSPAFPVPADSTVAEEWPLFSRGWAYQERMLSPRTIHFARCQIYWSCRSYFEAEDGHVVLDGQPLQEIVYGDETWTKEPSKSWRSMIEEFSGLALTYEKDRLPAIAAMVQRMTPLRPPEDSYVAGVWRNSILKDMCWKSVGEPRYRPSGSIPSWSWASINGRVKWPPYRPFPKTQLVQLQFTASGPAIIGAVSAATATLTGPILTGTVDGDDLLYLDYDEKSDLVYKAFQCNSPDLPDSTDQSMALFSADYGLYSAEPPMFEQQPLIAFIIGELEGGYFTEDARYANGGYVAIILRSTSSTADEFERIGIMEFLFWLPEEQSRMDTLARLIDSLPMTEIKIV